MYKKVEIILPDVAEELCRQIVAYLPNYFGLPDVNEQYAKGVRSNINLAAKVNDTYVGLISINFPYPKNAAIYWMGILPTYHRQGIGKILAHKAFSEAKYRGAVTICVETVSPKEHDQNYLKTYGFYESLGFSALFDLKPEGYTCTMAYMLKTLLLFVICLPTAHI